jgi:hypothetical protein
MQAKPKTRKSWLQLIIGGRSADAVPNQNTADEKLVTCPKCKGARTITDKDGKKIKCGECNGTGLVLR